MGGIGSGRSRKLTDEQVEQIGLSKEKATHLAIVYGVSPETIRRARTLWRERRRMPTKRVPGRSERLRQAHRAKREQLLREIAELSRPLT